MNDLPMLPKLSRMDTLCAPQRIALRLGEEGCYLFSIYELVRRISGLLVNPIDAYRVALKKGYIKEDCYVNEPCLILSMLMPATAWEMRKVPYPYAAAADEYLIIRYEVLGTDKKNNSPTMLAHFGNANKDGQVDYDPFGSSNTFLNGSPVSYRVFKRKI